MTKTILGVLIGLTLTTILAFNRANYEPKKSTAEVNSIEGLLIFIDSKPVLEYDYLGTVKSNTGGLGNPQYEGVRNRLIKNAKKEYPNADAIILQLNYGQTDKADVIKFK
jgi:hypothetical protein